MLGSTRSYQPEETITESHATSRPGKTGTSADQTLAWILTILALGLIHFFAVPEGRARIITRWGKFIRQAKPGMSFCWSFWGFWQRVELGMIDMRVQTREYPTKRIFTKDALECDIDTVVYFVIIDAGKALFKVDDYEFAIENFIQATLRNECGKKAARDLLSGR